MNNYSNYNKDPERLHQSVYIKTEQALSYEKNKANPNWKVELEQALRKVLRLPDAPALPPTVVVESETVTDDYKEIRFLYESEPEYFVPAHLLIPTAGTAPYPVIVCIQGHGTGMHNSLGRTEDGKPSDDTQGAYALQAIEQGYAALVFEQRALGESGGDPAFAEHSGKCYMAAAQAMLLGRTLVGERVFDVMRALDVLKDLPDIDQERIACMGNSGGGTTAFYATCLDKRIRAAMVSCSLCSYKGSIFSIRHCICNYVPDALAYFELHDLAALIAPRKLEIVAGREDKIFPLEEMRKSYKVIEAIYAEENAKENTVFLVGEGGHQFYPEESWQGFSKLTDW